MERAAAVRPPLFLMLNAYRPAYCKKTRSKRQSGCVIRRLASVRDAEMSSCDVAFEAIP